MLNKIKSISELYNEVKDYDLVISIDPALVTALNKSINKPIVGGFAYTPKEIASKNSILFLNNKVLDTTEVIIRIYNLINNTKNLKLNNIDLGFIHNTYLKIIDIYKNKGSINQIPSFLNKDELTVFNIYKNLNTCEFAIEKFNFQEIFPNKKLAIIGVDFFTELDKNILPLNYNYDVISIFKEDKFITEFNSFFNFDNNKELVDNLINLITKDNQNDVAIILNTNSEILPIIKSKLDNKEIDLNIKSYLYENIIIRDFINLIELSYNTDDLKIKDVAFFLNLLNIEINNKYYNYYLKQYINKINQNQILDDLYDILLNLKKENITYNKLYYFFENNKLLLPFQFKDVLYNLHIFNNYINLNNLKDLKYGIINLDLVLEKTKKGVLIVDCKNSMYVDKPVCFYVGLDNNWISNIKSKSYKDSKIQDQKAQDKFKILVQQGEYNYYFVTEYLNGQKTNPCFYFLKIFNKSIISFNDSIFNTKKIISNIKDKENKDISLIKNNVVDDDILEKKCEFVFSKTTLNNFVLCPKKLDFYKLLDQEDNIYLRKGTLLHYFCEFYIENKELVLQKGIDYFLDIIMQDFSFFINEIDYELERTNFKIALLNCIAFLNNLNIIVHNLENSLEKPVKNKTCNIFAKKLNVKLKSNNNEFYFENKTFSIKGVIDLIVNNNLIIDYKSSKLKKSTTSIFKNSNKELVVSSSKNENKSDYQNGVNIDNANTYENNGNAVNIDFQALLYILNLNSLEFNKNKNIEFHYYFPFSNKNTIIKKNIVDFKELEEIDEKGNQLYDSNIIKVKYVDLYYSEFIKTNEFIEILKTSQERINLINKIGESNLLNYLNNHDLEINILNYNLKDYQKLKWYDDLCKYIGEFTKSKKLILNIPNQIYKIRFCSYKNCSKVLFFKEDLDNFIKFLKEQYKLINNYLENSFEYKPLKDNVCKDCQYNTICLKRVLE